MTDSLFPDSELTSPEAQAAQVQRDQVREVYKARLAEKLKDPEFRKIEGFPLGTDEAILALSDPPYYTACPNPFIEEWLAENGKPYDAATDSYHREPFAADVSEGKNDPIYNAHSYHTKVPHKAIMRYILHYTEPVDVVYDGFCGTGMTGVAAQMCGNKAQVESLGYKVQPDGTILDESGKPFSKLGARKAILNDLSPAATFIAYNYNTPVDAKAFESEAKRILAEVEAECGWMYSTLHDASEGEIERVAAAVKACGSANELRELFAELKSGKSALRDTDSKMQVGRINYTVWSDVFVCPSCGGEIVFWDAAVDEAAGKVRDEFSCPSCLASVTKRRCNRAQKTEFDKILRRPISHAKQVPILMNYSLVSSSRRCERRQNDLDRTIIFKIEELGENDWVPSDELPDGFNTEQPKRSHGFTHAHHFYTARNLRTLSSLRKYVRGTFAESQFLCLVGDQLPRASKMHKIAISRLNTNLSKTAGVLAGTLYVPSNQIEYAVTEMIEYRIKDLVSYLNIRDSHTRQVCNNGSASNVPVKSGYIDYIFTDPPFGGNLMYSELNFLWEAWLRVKTNNEHEAITNNIQKKALPEYQAIMTRCFEEYYRVLKQGRWMTVEFHNSANSVWNSIQEGLERAGFIIADVRVLSKQQGTHKQVTASGAVKEDLVISCYKPRSEFETRFRNLTGTPESAAEFVRQHLSMLPVSPLSKGGKIEPVAERNRFLLFDRMIAYHLQKGAPIPLDASTFYKMLDEQFSKRDEMYFLPEQAARYDALKAQGVETEQLAIFVQDEKSAVQWVRNRLVEAPQTLGDLTPPFLQELREWPAHEPRPELKDLLREYFIQSDGGIWRVPNPDDEKDIEQLRKNALLKLFKGYTQQKGALKSFRTEALIVGFTHCYETHQYGVIVNVCEKVPEKILQEIQDLVMFYDIAKDLAPEENKQLEFVLE